MHSQSYERSAAWLAWIGWFCGGIAFGVVACSTPFAIAQEAKRAWQISSSEFIYEKASFPSCHASTLVECQGGIVAAWFGGTHEKHPDVGIWVSRRTVDGWISPVQVAKPSSHPTWNPVLFQPLHAGPNAPLVLFFKDGPSPQTWWGMMMTSPNGGATWSKPQRLPEGILGPIKNKPIELEDSTWLCPSSTESDEEESKWQVHFERTSDGGKTWQRTDPLNDGIAIQAIQPSLLRLPEHRLLAIGRTRQNRVFELESRDAGKTWSSMRLGDLPNNNSGLDAVTLKDGTHLIVYNHVPGTPGEWGGKRTPLNVAISSDGRNWKPELVLESEPGEFSYPAVIEASDGTVHITYTWNRKKIKHVVLRR
ncbi:MAG: exo-alpha-sialidase [Pirellula sp.]